ncbi:MAG TPA: aminopeptidase [Anaeromyxobacteraceae bacterium]
MRSLFLATLAFLSQSCFSARYVAQAARGQYEIMHAARTIREVVTDRDTPARTRRLLAAVRTIKAYGHAQGLKPTASYERYADLRRPAAAWVVQGCAPLSFDVKRWSFPLVGGVPYVGFFDERAARRYADALARDEGLDVDVRPASAFSTLGWFHDPVLSTMIGGGDEALGDLANVVLHESVHATLYVKDQSAFNESLASFVADRITQPWLASVLGPDAPETTAWVAAQARGRTRVERLHQAYVELEAVYRSGDGDAKKRADKERILEGARAELALARPLNNAALAGYRTYDTGVPAFERLLAACQGSWPRLFKALGTLDASHFGRPQQGDVEAVIDRVARSGCGG